MTTQEIEHQFLNISLTDRVAIIQRLTKNLITSRSPTTGYHRSPTATRLSSHHRRRSRQRMDLRRSLSRRNCRRNSCK